MHANVPKLPLLCLCKIPPGRNIDSLQCSTVPAPRLHVEQESIQCCTGMRLGLSDHVTADWRPLCKKTVIEASIWYRSDVAFATAFFQHWGTVLVSTLKTTTVTHDRSKHRLLRHCSTLSPAIRRKQQGFYWTHRRQIVLDCNTEIQCCQTTKSCPLFGPMRFFYIFNLTVHAFSSIAIWFSVELLESCQVPFSHCAIFVALLGLNVVHVLLQTEVLWTKLWEMTRGAITTSQ